MTIIWLQRLPRKAAEALAGIDSADKQGTKRKRGEDENDDVEWTHDHPMAPKSRFSEEEWAMRDMTVISIKFQVTGGDRIKFEVPRYMLDRGILRDNLRNGKMKAEIVMPAWVAMAHMTTFKSWISGKTMDRIHGLTLSQGLEKSERKARLIARGILLGKCWLLGDLFKAPKFQNDLMDQIIIESRQLYDEFKEAILRSKAFLSILFAGANTATRQNHLQMFVLEMHFHYSHKKHDMHLISSFYRQMNTTDRASNFVPMYLTRSTRPPWMGGKHVYHLAVPRKERELPADSPAKPENLD